MCCLAEEFMRVRLFQNFVADDVSILDLNLYGVLHKVSSSIQSSLHTWAKS
jgi:hypothetical protein